MLYFDPTILDPTIKSEEKAEWSKKKKQNKPKKDQRLLLAVRVQALTEFSLPLESKYKVKWNSNPQ